MLHTVGTHPGRNRLAAAVFKCLLQIFLVAGLAIHLYCAEFHIIHPVIFFVDVGRHHRSRLAVAGLVEAHLISIGSLGANYFGKFGIKRLQHLRTESKIACKFAGSACHAHCSIHILATLLGLTGAEIHRATVVGTIAIVGGVVLRQSHTHVVAVVGKLVIQFAFLGIHAIEPIHTPSYLVHNVGDTIGTGKAIGFVIVAKCFGILAVGKHQLIDGIGSGGGILQAVAGIMPSAAHVYVLPGLGGVIHYVAVFLMAMCIEVRIESATVLAQIVEHKIGSTVIHRAIDGKIGRARIAHADVIGAGSGKF